MFDLVRGSDAGRGTGSGAKQLRLRRDQIRFRHSKKDLLIEGVEERSRLGKMRSDVTHDWPASVWAIL